MRTITLVTVEQNAPISYKWYKKGTHVLYRDVRLLALIQPGLA